MNRLLTCLAFSLLSVTICLAPPCNFLEGWPGSPFGGSNDCTSNHCTWGHDEISATYSVCYQNGSSCCACIFFKEHCNGDPDTPPLSWAGTTATRYALEGYTCVNGHCGPT